MAGTHYVNPRKLAPFSRFFNISSVILLIIDVWDYEIDSGFFWNILAMAYPIVMMLLAAIWRGKIYVFNFNDDLRPRFAMGMNVCLFTMFLVSKNHFHVISRDALWLPASIVAIVLFLVIFYVGRLFVTKPQLDGMGTVIFLVWIFGYSATSIQILNCRLDSSQPQSVNARVVQKEVKWGRNSEYFEITVHAWNGPDSLQQISIFEDYYDALKPGDEVQLSVHDGLFNIPWYEFKE